MHDTTAARWRGAAFGLELSGTFAAPGLAESGAAQEGRPQVALDLARADDFAPGRGEQRVLSGQPLPGGSFTISAETGGYRLSHSYYGVFRVAEDGSRIMCAPNELPPWVWQRFLIAQPLPLVSLLHGYEPLHASAVGVDGCALLLMGTSGAGKSSVALQLVARGAEFLADDVTALELNDLVVTAHPGAPLSSVDERELDRLRQAGAHGWEVLGSLEGESRIVIADASRRALPVGAVHLLTRSEDVSAIQIVPPPSGAAKALLGGTFNAYLRSPARLARQLELSGRLAETAGVQHVRVPMEADAGTVAEAILKEAGS